MYVFQYLCGSGGFLFSLTCWWLSLSHFCVETSGRWTGQRGWRIYQITVGKTGQWGSEIHQTDHQFRLEGRGYNSARWRQETRNKKPWPGTPSVLSEQFVMIWSGKKSPPCATPFPDLYPPTWRLLLQCLSWMKDSLDSRGPPVWLTVLIGGYFVSDSLDRRVHLCGW